MPEKKRKPVPCTVCDGDKVETCSLCDGRGKHWQSGMEDLTCPSCKGPGTVMCSGCAGHGYVLQETEDD